MERHEKPGGPTEYSCRLQLPCNAPFEKLEGPVCGSMRLAQQAWHLSPLNLNWILIASINDMMLLLNCRLFVWLLAKNSMKWGHSLTCSYRTKGVEKKARRLTPMMMETHFLVLLSTESSTLKVLLMFSRLVFPPSLKHVH